MFLDYYGFREQPFGVTPDPRFLYFGASHREALASLYYGVESGRGFLALIAKPGMGKTTLLFHLLGKLRNTARTAFLFQTQCDSRQFLRSLLADLGVECGESDDLFHLQNRLNEVLVRETQSGRRFVLVVDEAQNLEDSVLETLRMLSNFETPRAKLMQIILAGQPQLANKLASERLVQLRQRVSIACRLTQLTLAETTEYIEHRLLVAGYTGKPLIAAGALERIARASEGIPRNINNLCFHALTMGFAKSAKRIGTSIVEEVLVDLALEPSGASVAREEKTIYDSAPMVAAHSSGQIPDPGKVRAAGWTHRILRGARHIARQARGFLPAGEANSRRRWAQLTCSARRAGAGLLTISTVFASSWLAFSRTAAKSEPAGNNSTSAQITNVTLRERVSPSPPLNAMGVRTRNSTRRSSPRNSTVAAPNNFDPASFVSSDDRILLKRFQTALTIASSQMPVEREISREKALKKDVVRACDGSDFSGIQAQMLFLHARQMSEDPWDGKGVTMQRCASLDGKSTRQNQPE